MIGRTHVVGLLVAFCVGLATGVFVLPKDPTEQEKHRAAEPRSIAPQEETPGTGQTQEREVNFEALSSPASATSTDVAERSQEKSPPPSHATNRAPTGDPNNLFQTGKDNGLAAADASAMQRLLDAVRINCQFGPGYGAQWNNGQASMLSASWQGGPIMYDQITMADGSAMMLGSEGATGSNTGEVKVRVAATKTGLHFSSFVPRGDLISTTVFPALDDKQRFIAVMSLHATGFNHNSSQFHGVCDVLY